MEKIICSSSVFVDESDKNEQMLLQAKIDKSLLEWQATKPKYRFLKNPVAVNKCNGTVLLSQYWDMSVSDAHDLIAELWTDCSELTDGNKLRTFLDEAALHYILETTSGLHSVTYGDTQVTSQVTSAIKKAGFAREYRQLLRMIKNCEARVRKETKTKLGNVSIERNLVECVRADGLDEVVLIGHSNEQASSGKLIAKVLDEKKIKALVFNRTKVETQLPRHEYYPLPEIKELGENYNSIITLESNNDTRPFINEIQPNFLNVYDITSPTVFPNGKPPVRKYMGLMDFQRIGDQTLIERKSDKNKVLNIIDETIASSGVR